MHPVDSALALLRDQGHPFLSSHVPMAVEALDGLGHAERAPAWARGYLSREHLVPIPPQPALPDDQLDDALGDAKRRAAWVARMDGELEMDGWQQLVRSFLPRLIPALACDATHGLIRTAHAIRSLRRRETEPRRHELAEALGSWAAAWETLPGAPGHGTPVLASQALTNIPTIPLSEQVYQGAITDRLRGLVHLDGFGTAVSAVAVGDDLAGFANDLSRSAALLYLANAPRARVIDFIHALDAVYAVRELLPWMDEGDARDALFYGWQAIAGLHASAGAALEPARMSAPDPSELPAWVERAIQTGGAHAIKFAQACVAEHEHRPDPVYLAALADMVARMEELKQKLGLVI